MTLKNRLPGLSLIFLSCLALNPGGASADDKWPQWGGPNRDHKSLATGLKQSWPEGGPKVAWKFSDAGIGYSSISVVGGKGYTLGTIDGKNYAICIDTQSGKQIWRTELSNAVPSSEYNQGWAGGPRSSPTVVGNQIIVLDDGGTLSNLDASSGDLKWKVNLKADFGGKTPTWGYSESPLVDGDRVIVCPGGKEFLVALELSTGKKIFGSSGFEHAPHYVSVIKHTVDNVPMYITAAQPGLVAFSTTDGSVLWTNGSSGNGTATIPTPVVKDNFVYHTSDYGSGCVLVDLTVSGGKVQAKEVYANKNMQNHHGGVVHVGDNIFGVKKGGGWVCQDFKSGEVKWNQRLSGDGSASVAFADGRLYVYGDGTSSCYLVEPSDSEWVERGKLVLPEQTKLDRKQGKIWAHPVIAEGKLFLRDMDLIYAFDIKN